MRISLLVLACSCSIPVRAETIVFKQGAPVESEALGISVPSYDGTQDSYVRAGGTFSGGASNFGAAPVFGVNSDSRFSLLRFDLSCLEGKFTEVHSVTLRLWTQQTDGTGSFDVHRLAPANSAWREGNHDGGVCLGCNTHIVTWFHLADFGGFPQPAPTWASGTPGPDVPGIDYDEVSMGFFDNEIAVVNDWSDVEIDGDVNALISDWASTSPTGEGGQSSWTPDWNWRRPAPVTANEGFLLRGFDGGTTWIYSSEAPAEFCPELIIDLDPAPGAANGVCGGDSEIVTFERGDINDDGVIDVSDIVTGLLFLFAGESVGCEDAGDIDDDGELAVTDAIFGLQHLFQGGPSPSEPFPACGADTTDDDIGCLEYSSCN